MANYNLGEARGKIVLETDFSGLKDGQKALDSAKDQAQASGQTASQAWGKVGTAATVAGVTVAAGFGTAVAAASNFEFQLSAIQAVSGATSQEMDLISAAALRIGKDTSFSASEAAQAMEELVKAGVSTKDVLNGAADATVALAAAGGVDLPTAATIAANAMNQFNLTAEDMVGITDSIAGAANASAIDVNDLGMSMGQVGAVANLLGLSFDDTALAIAAMGNAGIKGSDAGTSLKTMLMNLQPATDGAREKMEELGLITADGANQFFTAEGSIKSMAEISDVLSTALAGMSDAQKQATLTALFGTDAVRGAAVVANTGADGFNALSDSMHAVSTADVAATRMDNLKGSTEALMGSIETVAIQVGTLLLPRIREMVDSISAAVDWFASLDEGTQKTIVTMVGLAGAFLTAFGLTVKITQGIVATRAAILAINAALAANPIGIIIVAIAALVAGLIWFFTQTELGQQIVKNVTQFIQEAWANVVSFLTPIFEWIGEAAVNIWNGIQAAVGAVITWFQTYVLPIIEFVINAIVAYWTFWYQVVVNVVTGIMTVVGAVVDWFMTYVYPVIAAVVGFIVAVFGLLWDLVQLAWIGIQTFINDVVTNIVSFLTTVWTEFSNFWTDIWTAISDFITSVWNAIVSFLTPIITSIIAWIMDKWNMLMLGLRIIMNQIKSVIDTVWNAIKGFIEPIVQGIVNFVTNTWNGLVGIVSGIFNNVYNSIKDPLDRALSFIGGIKDTIIGFFRGAGDWLFNAGKDIIGGFMRGLESMLGGIADFFTGITAQIPNLKGPPEKDKVLLTENGRLIMQSLANGLKDELGGVYGLLNGMNATIPATLNSQINAQVSGAGGKAPVTINFTYNASEGDTLTENDVLSMLGHATELVREELD